MPINPNSDKDHVNGYSAKPLENQVNMYPQFFSRIEFETFRHIQNLSVEFKNSRLRRMDYENKGSPPVRRRRSPLRGV